MFWGLILEPYKRYTQCVEQAFHLSMACLDVSQAHSESIQVMLKYNDRNFLLCTLNKNTVFQTPLDVLFEKGDNITFYCNGRGSVHMTGYLLPNDLLDSDSDSDSEIKEEQKGEEIELNTIPEKSLKRKAESPKIKKKAKIIKKKYFEGNNWDDDDDDDDDDDEDEENNSSLENDSDDDTDIEDEEDEIDNDDDDVEEEEEQEEEEEEQEQQQQQQQEKEQEHEHKHKHKHEKIAKPQKHEKKEIEDQQQNKQKKKHDKQNKINGEEVKQEQQRKKQKKKAEQQTQKNNLIEAKKRIIEGGVQVEDIKLGNGALATSGKLITVYYVGRCKIGKEERKVDSYTQGNGFKFRLGKGEVIKGWDVGISGMKVGGKRRLTIPPNMGYGAKGSLPTIPANSTLVFEVELKNVN